MRVLSEAGRTRVRWRGGCLQTAVLAAVAASLAFVSGIYIGLRNSGGSRTALITGGPGQGSLVSSPHGTAGGMVLPLPLPPPPDGVPHFRLPPERLTQWTEYAKARQCSTDDTEYEQIFSDLAPFRAAGGISEASVEAAHARLDSTTLYALRGGAVVNASSWGENRQSVVYWRRLLEELAPLLPDMKLVFNSYDKPRSWTAPIPAAAEAALAAGTLNEIRAWLLYGCDGAGLSGIKHMHSAFAHTQVRPRRGPFPVLSGAKIQGCFGDILTPRLWPNNDAQLQHASQHSGCPLLNESWEDKRDIAFWRGTTTGAWIDASVPPQMWQGWQRERLVHLSRQHPTHLDAAFTGLANCATPQCRELSAYYGLHPSVKADQSFHARYQVVVDGNSIAARLALSLCSGCLTLLGQLFTEWWAFRLVPYTHFLPLRLDFSDLVGQVEWAREHPEEVRQMVAAGQEFINTRLREQDIKCYMYRLLLEYADLYRPANSSSASGSSNGGGGRNAATQQAAADVGAAGGGSAGGDSGPAQDLLAVGGVDTSVK